MENLRVRGILIKSLKDFVLENYGSEGFEKLLNSLGDEAKKLLKGVFMYAASYDGNLFLEINRKICEIFGGGIPEFARKLGAYSAQKSARGPFKYILKIASIPWALKRGESIYNLFYIQMGKLKVVKIDDRSNEGVIIIENVNFKDLCFENRIAGWIEEIGRILGSEKASVKITKSVAQGDEVIEYLVRW